MEAASTALATTTPDAPLAAPKRKPRAGQIIRLNFETVQGFEACQRLAIALAASTVVPVAFQGKAGTQGYSNCLVALEMATRLDLPPLMVMQNVSIIDGKPGWLGKFFIALINKSARFSPLVWETKGTKYLDDYGVRCVATRLVDGSRCEGTWITVSMCKAEGWWSKKGSRGEYSKWQSMPDQMFVYRSASFWAQQWFPEGTLGLPSADQLEDQTGHQEQAQQPRLTAPSATNAPALTAAPPAPSAAEQALGLAAAAHGKVPEVPPEDRTLEPGQDPAAMDAAAPVDGDPLAEVRALLEAGNKRDAIGAIGRLPREHRKAAQELYNAATKRNA